MTQFILASEETRIQTRATFDTEVAFDDRLDDLLGFLELVGIQPLTTSHQVHAVAGPEHEHFETALAAYGLTFHRPCAEKIVNRAMEMLVAGELIQLTQIDDGCLRSMLATGFATEQDWQELGRSADVVARSYLAEHYEGFELDPALLDAKRLSAYSALAGGILVAMAQARAEWRA